MYDASALRGSSSRVARIVPMPPSDVPLWVGRTIDSLTSAAWYHHPELRQRESNWRLAAADRNKKAPALRPGVGELSRTAYAANRGTPRFQLGLVRGRCGAASPSGTSSFAKS